MSPSVISPQVMSLLKVPSTPFPPIFSSPTASLTPPTASPTPLTGIRSNPCVTPLGDGPSGHLADSIPNTRTFHMSGSLVSAFGCAANLLHIFMLAYTTVYIAATSSEPNHGRRRGSLDKVCITKKVTQHVTSTVATFWEWQGMRRPRCAVLGTHEGPVTIILHGMPLDPRQEPLWTTTHRGWQGKRRPPIARSLPSQLLSDLHRSA